MTRKCASRSIRDLSKQTRQRISLLLLKITTMEMGRARLGPVGQLAGRGEAPVQCAGAVSTNLTLAFTCQQPPSGNLGADASAVCGAFVLTVPLRRDQLHCRCVSERAARSGDERGRNPRIRYVGSLRAGTDYRPAVGAEASPSWRAGQRLLPNGIPRVSADN